MESVLSTEDLKYVLDRYKKRILEHGVTFESMKSGTIDKQQIRHAVHSTSFRSTNPKVLDIGCGLAQFYTFLKEKNIPCQYLGYDILEDYIEKCKKEIPECTFESRNIFEKGIEGIYDNIVMSQVLNNKYSSSDNLEVMKTAIAMAFKHTTVGVSIDMMSSYVDFKSDELYYYSPEKVFEFAKTLTKRVVLRHDFRPYEFCIQLFHQDADGYVS